MKEAIYTALRPVRSRQRLSFTLRCVIGGLAVGAVATAAAFVAGQWLELPREAGLAVLATGPILGLVAGLLARRRWHAAAAAVDSHYALKDRAVTALAFADQPQPGDLHALQMSDAMGHLANVEPKAVVPLKAPKAWPAAAAAAIAAGLMLVFWPTHQREAEAAPLPAPEHVVEVAKDKAEKTLKVDKALAEMFADTDDEKAGDDKKGMKELMEKLAKKLEEMTENGMTEREALAKLSEMIAQNQAMLDMLNVAALDGQLGSLGTAMAASQAFEGAGKALQKGDLEKAAKELEKLDEVKLTPKEAKAMEEKLKEVAKKMGEAGLGSLSEATGELADSLKGGNGKVGKSAKNLGKKLNYAAKKKKAAELLNALNEEFKDGKCECDKNGGARIRQTAKSNNPSSNWGRAISGNVDGEKTRLGAKRTEVQVTGTPGGEGDSDVETTTTPEARERASRAYQEKFNKGKRESEAVLDAEPIPLGHRQMVKKYFELIRPSNADATAEKKAETKDAPKADEKK